MTAARASAAKSSAKTPPASKNTPAGLNVLPLGPLLTPAQGGCACGGVCPRCQRKSAQPKRARRAPDDEERDADDIAANALRAPETSRVEARAPGLRERLGDRPQTPASSGDAAQRSPDVPHFVDRVLRAPGRAIDTQTRAEVESRFGENFADVRLHTDPRAGASARSLDARAYTVGRHIVFAPSQYQPATTAGRALLAHELAHVVQQRGGAARLRRKAAIGELPPPNEVDLDAIADQVYDAMAGWGTDEEAVYRGLQQLRRDPAMINQLIQRYAQRHNGADLIADINDDFSDTELEYALQLLGRGHVGTKQEIVAGPEATTNVGQAAQRLREAMEGWGTDEEAIYATLLPFNRDTKALEATYQMLYGESLRERIIDEMSGSELDYALSLLSFDADSFLEQNFKEADRPLARKILNDILAVKTDRLDFADDRELAIEIQKRLRTSQLMQESQSDNAFAYPESCTQDDCPGDCVGHGQPGESGFVPPDINRNAHVNKDARDYWMKSVDSQNLYQFTLTPSGFDDPLRALVKLFTPQNSICEQTLIHCDYLTTVIHMRVFAESIGSDVFKQRVQSGALRLILSYWGFRDLMPPATPGSPEGGYAQTGAAVSLQAVQPSSEDELIIGDHVVFWNHLAYDALTASATWSGPWRLENALLVDQDASGENLYEGHGAPSNEAQEVVKGDKRMVLKDMVGAYNGPAQAALNIVDRVKNHDAGAEADLHVQFPRVVADPAGNWWIAERDDRDENAKRPKRFYELRLLTGVDDPDLIGLRDPTDPTKMGWVKRPIESAPGRSPS